MTAPCPRLGFIVTIELAPSLDDAMRGRFRAAWTALLGARGLHGGDDAGDRAACVVESESSQATDADRVALQGWLACQPQVRRWQVSPLLDLRATSAG